MSHPNDSIPEGFCQCGCGERTRIATRNVPHRHVFLGKPYRFIAGHQRRKSPVEYIVDERTGCWEWQRTKSNGYGQIGSRLLAHRVFYERTKGPIPDGTEIDHLCRNRGCVNPDHLEAVPHIINSQRATAKFTPEQATAIRAESASMTVIQLSAKYGVSRGCIYSILRGRSYKNRTVT